MLALYVVLAAVAIGAGLAIAWYMGNHGGAPYAKQSVPILQPVEVDPLPVAPSNGRGRDPAIQPQERGWTNPAPPPEVQSESWDQRLDKILMLDGEPNEKSDKILQVLASAPAESQVEIVPHLLNMTQDDHYDGVAGLLTNAATPSAVSTLLMNDLLNRRNNLKLPMLLAVASTADHPLKDQAKDMLELFLQADYGANWDQWGSAVNDWLQQNP